MKLLALLLCLALALTWVQCHHHKPGGYDQDNNHGQGHGHNRTNDPDHGHGHNRTNEPDHGHGHNRTNDPDHGHGHNRTNDPDHGHGHNRTNDHDQTNDHDHERTNDHGQDNDQDHELDRCKGMEMDAVAVNEEGIPYFFKGDHLFKGFHGHAELSNESFAELDDHHHLGHVDAAFRMHFENSSDHDHMFFFLDDKVFSYYQHKLEEGFPKNISEVFPAIPDHLDAAVECPHPECDEDSVIFFKGDRIYHYKVETKLVDRKKFHGMPNCTSAFRFMEHYYCFHGHMFSKFDPKTGDVHGKYPKEARDYFMRCAKFSEDSDHVERERCSRVHLDAITVDDDGNMHAFRGHYYLYKDANSDNMTADTIESAFKELHSEVDAVFSHDGHLYMIKDDHVFLYKDGEPHTHVDGYPKSVKEELGLEGPIDAAFMCNNQNTTHVVKGNKIYVVDMNSSPREATECFIRNFRTTYAAMCDSTGVYMIVGNHYYHYKSILGLNDKMFRIPDSVPLELFGCDH